MESYTGDYQCRTELHLNTSSKLQQNCYLLSKPVTVFVTPLDNNISTTTTVTDPYTSTSMYTTNMTPTQHTKNPIIHIVVPASASVGGVIVITLISVLVVYKCVKHYCQQRQPYNGELLEGEIHNNQEVQNGFIEHGDIRNDDNEGDGNGVAAEERHRLLDFQGGGTNYYYYLLLLDSLGHKLFKLFRLSLHSWSRSPRATRGGGRSKFASRRYITDQYMISLHFYTCNCL